MSRRGGSCTHLLATHPKCMHLRMADHNQKRNTRMHTRHWKKENLVMSWDTQTLNSNVLCMVQGYLVQDADLCCVTSIIATNEKHCDETVHADHNDPGDDEFLVFVDSNYWDLAASLCRHVRSYGFWVT